MRSYLATPNQEDLKDASSNPINHNLIRALRRACCPAGSEASWTIWKKAKSL